MATGNNGGENNWFVVGLCATCLFLNSYALTNVFPYLGPMIVHLGKADDIDEAGYYVGFLGSAFMAARVFTAFFWGELSDLIGRRPVLLIGCCGFCIFQLFLGLSTTFEMALAARFLMGLFNPLNGAAKTVVCEVVENKNQGKAMGQLSGWAALGMVVGPALGGALADPANSYPNSVFAGSEFFMDFPYILPNLFGSVVSMFTFFGILFCLPETLETDDSSEEDDCYVRLGSDDESYNDVEARAESREPEDTLSLPLMESSADENKAVSSFKSKLYFVVSTFCCPFGRMYELLRQKDKLLASLSYSLYAFIGIYTTELLPLYFITTSKSGGLGFSTGEIGVVMSISGGVLFMYNSFIFPCYATKLNPVRLYQMGLFGIMVGYLVIPSLTNVQQLSADKSGGWFLAVVVAVVSLRVILNGHAFVACNILVNNSCETSERGAMNGLVMTLGSLFKALGPIVGSTIFAWSINNGKGFPLDYHLAFYFAGFLVFVLLLLTRVLPASLNESVAES